MIVDADARWASSSVATVRVGAVNERMRDMGFLLLV